MDTESYGPVLFLYGPPGSGKSTTGEALADALSVPFWDLDGEIEAHTGMPVAEIFAIEGEEGFRAREKRLLDLLIGKAKGVVALGGGALLDAENRARVEAAGPVICLKAPVEELIERLHSQVGQRPLLLDESGSTGSQEVLRARLSELLERRSAHYASFSHQLDAGGLTPQGAAWEVQVRLGRFRVRGMGDGYDVLVLEEGRGNLGVELRNRSLNGPVALVSDENVGGLYASTMVESLHLSGFHSAPIQVPAGEAYKTVDTLDYLWDSFVQAGLERSSTVVALGGGVVSDLAGFAAATFLRGLPWVCVPTSLLAMVDASLGGKTGVDLSRGKNLVGSFHPPDLVLVDPQFLATLPEVELRAGMAEVVKAGIIGDPRLFSLCGGGLDAAREDLVEIVRRGMAVKVQVIQADPYEKGERAALNLGHTIGHALEQASGFKLRHGEAVAVGLVAEARLSELIGLAQLGLAGEIAEVLSGLGLPIDIPPGLDPDVVAAAMAVDKKRAAGKPLLSLPACIGQVQVGCEVQDLERLVRRLLESTRS